MVDAKQRFETVPTKISFPEMEQAILQRWQEQETFRQVLDVRSGAPLFVFYEGPPTANGAPGIHHVLARAYKDLMIRYKTMRGYMPVRRGGWDTHGLPVELEVEKELGLSNKQDIEAFGIEEFNRRCRESVFRYIAEWRSMSERTAVWLDMDDAYVTYDNSYVENCWWVFKRLWDAGLVYEGFRVTPHCPRCVTSLSSHELSLGYKDDTLDPSIYVRFPLASTQDEVKAAISSRLDVAGDHRPSALVWTTTPWTLSANTALAVAPDEDYVLACPPADSGRDERVILAANLVEPVLGEGWRELDRFRGQQLLGLRYEAPYAGQPNSTNLHHILSGSFVTTDDGTGIVHSAPAYGADDAELGREFGLPVHHTVDLHGILTDGFPGSHKFVKDADRDIILDLDNRGLLFNQGTYRHAYPFCWRCDTPLLYYAKTSWYIQTTAQKGDLLAGNQAINWHPEHIREGRFGEWLRGNVDWAVSRERYWGTPLPIWRCEDCGELDCVGSVEGLADRATLLTKKLVNELDLHRPHVDRVELTCNRCGAVMRRVPEVADAWYDSGAMPFAQWKYPVTLPTSNGMVTLTGVEDLLSSDYYPADFITEAIDQTRGWFYSLLAESVLVDPQRRPSYKNVIVLGLILDENGDKMSKSKGNVVDPWTVIDDLGADALRWYLYTAAPTGVARRFSVPLVQESLRRFLLTFWNTCSFFVTYAVIDGFRPEDHARHWKKELGGPSLREPPASELDRWIMSELNALVADVTDALERFNPTDAGRRIEEFTDRLSNWYVRRSRRRFWKSKNDEDKTAAYIALYSCLMTLSKLMAPLTPFVADAIYSNLASEGHRDSVHLADWPQADHSLRNENLETATRLAMRIASLGRAARSKTALKVRQPLARVLVQTRPGEEQMLQTIEPQVLDELNVKELVAAVSGELASVSVRPNLPLLGPKYGPQLNSIRAAIDEAESTDLVAQVRAGGDVRIGKFTLKATELLIAAEEKDGFAMESEEGGGLVVAIDTTLTPELKSEGFARELVHRIQNLRRDAGFDIADRIVTYVGSADKAMQESTFLSEHGPYVRAETLSEWISLEASPSGSYTEAQDIEGFTFTLSISKVK